MTVGRILVAKGRDVVTIQPHRSVLDAAGLLARKGIGALIVVDSETRVRGVFPEYFTLMSRHASANSAAARNASLRR